MAVVHIDMTLPAAFTLELRKGAYLRLLRIV